MAATAIVNTVLARNEAKDYTAPAAIDGTVDEVFAAPGDIVQAGQLLLKLRV